MDKIDELIEEMENKVEKEGKDKKMQELIEKAHFIRDTHKSEIAETLVIALIGIKRVGLEGLNYNDPAIQALVKTCIEFGFVKGYETGQKEDK